MRIEKVVLVKGVGGYFFDDQSAIKSGLPSDGFIYEGTPKTSGFMTVRMPSESICIALMLDNGDIALGDCCAVQYSGVGGRDRLFLAEAFIPWINEHIRPKLLGFDCSSFKGACEVFDSCTDSDGHPAHAAIRYGVTQALLDAVAKSRQILGNEPLLDAAVALRHRGQTEMVSVRWVVVHLLTEYARHCGHADLIREAIDGATGDYS